ncbi:MAG: hypothetical protein KAJ19_08130, partial [Gammaproteobacteria bacterium]|nr:hypothetical protein [Gammaproteobacteria bacterium]
MLNKVMLSTMLAIALVVFSGLTRADDTEIYFQTGVGNAGRALVMFTLDYTPDLGNNVCSDASSLVGLRASGNASCQALADSLTTDDTTSYFIASDFNGSISSFEMLRAVLKKVLIPLDDIDVGLMINHVSDNNCAGFGQAGCSNGSYILQGFIPFETGDTNGNKAAFFAKLDAIPEPTSPGHPNQNKEMYFELYRYLSGRNIYNGHNGWNDFKTSSTCNLHHDDDLLATCTAASTTGNNPLMWDESIEVANKDRYKTPFVEDCSKVFVVNLTGGGGNSANDSDDDIKKTIANDGMNITDLSTNDPGFEEMIEWLNDVDLVDGVITRAPTASGWPLAALEGTQNVTSFFVSLNTSQVDAAALVGGTTEALALTSDPSEVEETMNKIFNQILSVSTTFVSASIPVNVFNRSEVLDNVFIALFKTDADSKPQWPGNVKKLKLNINDLNALELIDANSAVAIATDGRIKNDALTFWSNPAGYDVVDFNDQINEVTGKDGRSVNRGGAGQKIPNFLSGNNAGTPSTSNTTGTRQLFTEPATQTNGTSDALLALNADTTTAQALWSDLSDNTLGMWDGSDEGSPTHNRDWISWTDAGTNDWDSAGSGITLQEEAVNLLEFIRGANPDGSHRRWAFGDPLHSRPLPINYGDRGNYTVANPDVRILVGSNDGFLRMLRNTDDDATGTAIGTQMGDEVWAFMPKAVMPIQKQLRHNASGGSPVHPYGIDGPPVAYYLDSDKNGKIDHANDKVHVYFGLRRGGNAYYALDITAPDTPKLLWMINNDPDGDGTPDGDFAEMGLTFSTPVVKKLSWHNGTEVVTGPVLIFAGGYDIDKDGSALGTNDSEGNAIFIVDA